MADTIQPVTRTDHLARFGEQSASYDSRRRQALANGARKVPVIPVEIVRDGALAGLDRHAIAAALGVRPDAVSRVAWANGIRFGKPAPEQADLFKPRPITRGLRPVPANPPRWATGGIVKGTHDSVLASLPRDCVVPKKALSRLNDTRSFADQLAELAAAEDAKSSPALPKDVLAYVTAFVTVRGTIPGSFAVAVATRRSAIECERYLPLAMDRIDVRTLPEDAYTRWLLACALFRITNRVTRGVTVDLAQTHGWLLSLIDEARIPIPVAAEGLDILVPQIEEAMRKLGIVHVHATRKTDELLALLSDFTLRLLADLGFRDKEVLEITGCTPNELRVRTRALGIEFSKSGIRSVGPTFVQPTEDGTAFRKVTLEGMVSGPVARLFFKPKGETEYRELGDVESLRTVSDVSDTPDTNDTPDIRIERAARELARLRGVDPDEKVDGIIGGHYDGFHVTDETAADLLASTIGKPWHYAWRRYEASARSIIQASEAA